MSFENMSMSPENSGPANRGADHEYGKLFEPTPEQSLAADQILEGSELENATFGDEENTPTSTNYSPQN